MENTQTSARSRGPAVMRQSGRYRAPAKIPSAANNSEGCGPVSPSGMGSGGNKMAAAMNAPIQRCGRLSVHHANATIESGASSAAAKMSDGAAATSALYTPMVRETRIQRGGCAARASIIAGFDARQGRYGERRGGPLETVVEFESHV